MAYQFAGGARALPGRPARTADLDGRPRVALLERRRIRIPNPACVSPATSRHLIRVKKKIAHIRMRVYTPYRMLVPQPPPSKILPQVFKALSDPTRLRLLNLMIGEEVCVCHLAEILNIVQPKASRHLAYLKKVGLVVGRRDGQWMYYSWAVDPNPIVQSTLEGLRNWMCKDEAYSKERQDIAKRKCK